MSLGWALKTYRTRPCAGITQKTLAKKTGIAYTRIAKFESGFAIPSTLEIKAISKALKVKPEMVIALAKAGEPMLEAGND